MSDRLPQPPLRPVPLYCLPRRCCEAWREARAPPQVLRVVQSGLRLRFARNPKPYMGKAIPVHTEDRVWLQEEVRKNLERGSWERLGQQPAFCAPAFIVTNAVGKRRVVVDLRYINSCLPQRSVRYETLRSFRSSIRPSMRLLSLDLESGYHHVGVHPTSRRYLGFQIDGMYFQCAALPFGLNLAPLVFTKFMRVLVRLWRSRGWAVLPYLDDFLFGFDCEADAKAAAVRIDADLVAMGLRRNLTKGCWTPTSQLQHLGMELDTDRMIFRATPQTETRLRAFALDITHIAARRQRMVPVTLLAKFAGLAVSQLLAVPEARLMLRHVHDVVASARSWKAKVRVSTAALSELQWWGAAPWNPGFDISLPSPTLRVATDASDIGWGAAVLGTTMEAAGTFSVSEFAQPIMVRELLAVKLALQSFGQRLRHQHFELLIDNQPAAFSLINLTSRSVAVRTLVAEIWSMLKGLRARMWVQWIPTEQNERADRLSRSYDRNDWRLRPATFNHLCTRWGRPRVDAFASRVNTQLPAFYSRRFEPGAAAVDGLAQSWEGDFIYGNPPWPLIGAVVNKLERTPSADALLVLPYWPSAEWYPRLRRLTSEQLVMSTDASTFSPASSGNSKGVGAPSWQLLAVRVRPRC